MLGNLHVKFFPPRIVYYIYASEHFKKSKRASIYLICKTMSNSQECIFHDFDILVNIAKNVCTREKNVIYGIPL